MESDLACWAGQKRRETGMGLKNSGSNWGTPGTYPDGSGLARTFGVPPGDILREIWLEWPPVTYPDLAGMAGLARTDFAQARGAARRAKKFQTGVLTGNRFVLGNRFESACCKT